MAIIAYTPDQIRPEDYPHPHPKTGAIRGEQHLVDDPETGMMIKIQTYPAGDVGPEHTHHCGHGMYVIKGTLHTNVGDFGPGSFVWFPEGDSMYHGATNDGPVEVLFITNKKWDLVVDGVTYPG